MATEVEVIIDEEGHAEIHVKGVKGALCMAKTAELEAALGTVTKRRYTPEMQTVKQTVKGSN